MRYRKNPVIIEAVNLSKFPESIEEILSWSTKKRPIVIVKNNSEDTLYAEITTLEGVMRANEGDWLIKGVNDEVYPCKPDIFEKTYELVSE